MKNFVLLSGFLIFTINIFGQSAEAPKSVTALTANYSFNIPAKDLANRFGVNSGIGSSFIYKTKSHWMISIEAMYLFGNQLKEDSILDQLKTPKGEIINRYGEYSNYILSERGFYIGIGIGKVIIIPAINNKSGILIKTSAGFLQHKIKIQNEGNNTPQILDEYSKGYDRLTNGFAINEFIGLLYMSSNRFLNFYAGFEFYQSWTKNRRDFNFDTMMKDNTKRKDYLYGFKIAWIIPFYQRMPDKYYYN